MSGRSIIWQVTFFEKTQNLSTVIFAHNLFECKSAINEKHRSENIPKDQFPLK